MTLSMSLLLIDDNGFDAELLQANLQAIPSLSCRLNWVSDYEKGLAAVCQNDHDICLIDHNLGAQTGSDLIREAVKMGCTRPLILYSGREDVRLGVEAIALGAADYLVKDHIDPFLLEKTLRNILERDRMVQENARMQAKLFETQRLESLGLMASGIAHDFNNILGIILANAELALQHASATEETPVSRHLASIRLATERAADLTSQMLAYSGRGRFRTQTLDLTEIALESLDFCRLGIPRRVALAADIPGKVPPVHGDLTQVRQVLLNLLNNAADSIEGEGTVTLETLQGEVKADEESALDFVNAITPGKYAVIKVADTGCGIPADQVTRIFDPFFTTKATGRGLGLAAVLGIVKAHRGGLRVLPGPEGQGTWMEVWLPLNGEAWPSGKTALPPKPREEQPMREGEKLGKAREFAPVPDEPAHSLDPQAQTVLVVDDEAGILQALEIMLQARGYHTELAANADHALKIAQACTLNAAVVDIMLAGRSGVDLFQDLRRILPGLPVVFISGYNESEALLPLVKKGEVQYLRKPFTSTQLMEALEKACASSKHPKMA